MFKNEFFRIFLISLLISLSALIVSPRISVVVENEFIKLDSYIGGYEIKLPGSQGSQGKTLDLKNFRKGLDVGGGSKIIFKVDTSEFENEERVTEVVKEISERKMHAKGYTDFNVGIENIDERKFYVEVPEYISSDDINSFVTGTGKLVFKKLANPDEWDPENFAQFYIEESRWAITDINENDIKEIRTLKDATGRDQMQIIFTLDGKKKFHELAKENLNNPLGIFINGLPYPFAMPLVSESVVSNPESDLALSGGFSPQVVKDFILQMATPLPTAVTYVEKISVDSNMGNDFIYKYSISLLIGLVLVCVFFIVRFGYLGIVFDGAFIISALVFSALAKLFSIPISVVSLVGVLILVISIVDVGYTVTHKIKKGVLENKPFDLLLYQSFGKDKDKLEMPAMFILLLSITSYFFVSGNLKSLLSLVCLNVFVVILFYTFIMRTFFEVFGGDVK